jgi:hypothetical protein
MRRIGFKAKALTLILIFLVPLTLATLFLINVQRSQIAFAENERQGVTYARAILPLQRALQDQRKWAMRQAATGTPPPEATATQQQVQASLKALEQVEQQLGPVLGTADAFKQLQQGIAATTPPAPGEALLQVTERHKGVAQSKRPAPCRKRLPPWRKSTRPSSATRP